MRLHLTNVCGMGASELLLSLLPALEAHKKITVEKIYLPNRGKLAQYRSINTGTVTEVYRRYLPNVLSRFLECTLLAGYYGDDTPLLVFGDLPLQCRGPQILFVQTSHLIKPENLKLDVNSVKYYLMRILFGLGIGRVRAFIVQTTIMREALVRSYPTIANRVHIIPQPVPAWLLNSGLKRNARVVKFGASLKLIYPAAGYPHKNHALLYQLDSLAKWPIQQLTLTIDRIANPAPHLSWVKCSGFLSPPDMIRAYSEVDALLFLSKEESYGFPLVEAIFVGLPIVCPDLPYARTLCGDQAIYFDPDVPESLHQAFITLQNQLNLGWWPDWSRQLINIPTSWEAVADSMLSIASVTQ